MGGREGTKTKTQTRFFNFAAEMSRDSYRFVPTPVYHTHINPMLHLLTAHRVPSLSVPLARPCLLCRDWTDGEPCARMSAHVACMHVKNGVECEEGRHHYHHHYRYPIRHGRKREGDMEMETVSPKSRTRTAPCCCANGNGIAVTLDLDRRAVMKKHNIDRGALHE